APVPRQTAREGGSRRARRLQRFRRRRWLFRITWRPPRSLSQTRQEGSMHRLGEAFGRLVPVMGLAVACSQGCGSDTPGAPPGPSLPAPVATAAFVHVLAPPQVTASVEQAMLSTFAVTPPT